MNHLITATAFLGSLAAGQDYLNTPNPRHDILTCRDLPCDPAGENICARNNDNNNNNGTQPGVGIVPSALTLGSTDISLALIAGNLDAQAPPSNDKGGPAQWYQSTDVHLFVGIDPSLAAGDYPSGCMLMLQYYGQTFPEPTEESARPDGINGTTSCQGVVDNGCRSDIYDAIQSFNTSSVSAGSNTACQALADHVTTNLARRPLCGENLIASMIRATGGALPRPDTAVAQSPKLSDVNECQPMLPQSFSMFEVVETQMWSLAQNATTESMDRLFGDRVGFTPVFSVRFRQGEGVEVQLACLQTYEPSGEGLGQGDVQQEAVAATCMEKARISAFAAGFVALVFAGLMI